MLTESEQFRISISKVGEQYLYRKLVKKSLKLCYQADLSHIRMPKELMRDGQYT